MATKSAQSQPRRRVNPLTAGISGGASLLFIAALWLLFAPVNLGGKFAYFFVVGNSMEPHITAKDLVLLRSADRYEVGDVIGYRDPDLGTVVHRVRALDGDRYITRGDNRDSDDGNRPFQDDVVGKEWHVLRNGANVVRTLQSPKSAVFLTIASVTFGMMTAKPRAVSRRMRRTIAKRTPAWVGQVSYKSMNGDQIVTLASTMLFTAVGLAVVMMWNGSERTITKDIVLEQTGKLQYTANAGTGLYDGDKVTTGQPIFTQIGTQMPVSFTYEVVPTSKDATVGGVRGMVRMWVELSQENNWKREFEILAPTPFAGTIATAQGLVDIKTLQDTAARMEQAALLKYPEYTVNVIAEVKANGNITGRAQDYSYRAEYPFELHELQLIPGQKFEAKQETPLNVKRDSVEPWATSLPVVGIRIGYTTLQALILVLGIGGAAGMAFVYASTMLAARGGETALILSRYAPLLVSVQAADVDFGGRIVAVKKFEDLVRMARADGLFVVHAENGVADHFLLVTPEVTYLYSVPRAPEKFRFDEEVQPSPNETLAGLTRPDTARPLSTPALAVAGAGGPATTFRASIGGRATEGPITTPVGVMPTATGTAPSARPVAPNAPSIPADRGPLIAPQSPAAPSSPQTTPAVSLATSPAPTSISSSPTTGARPLPPTAARPASIPTTPGAPPAPVEVTAAPEGSTQGPKPAATNGKRPPTDPPAAPSGGKALV